MSSKKACGCDLGESIENSGFSEDRWEGHCVSDVRTSAMPIFQVTCPRGQTGSLMSAVRGTKGPAQGFHLRQSEHHRLSAQHVNINSCQEAIDEGGKRGTPTGWEESR